MKVVDFALKLAASKLLVFPCGSSKSPATPNGFHDASANPDDVRALWRDHPGPLIGVPTGAISNIDVVDIDGPRHAEAADWWQQNRYRFPPTRTHTTRSGGLHLLLRHAEGMRSSASRICTGVDVRADGGYVIWWPATGAEVINPDDIASWPAWLIPSAKPPVPVRVASAPIAANPGDVTARNYALAGLRNAIERVATAGEGQRNVTLNREAFGLSRFAPNILTHAEIADALAAAALTAGLPPAEVVKTLVSALRAGGGH